MRVLLLSFWFSEYCVKLANSLSKHAAVKLMLPENIAGDAITHLSQKVQVELFRKVERRNPANLLYSINILRSAYKYEPDVIHIQCNGHAWFSFLLPFVKLGNKLILTIHDPVPHPGEETSVRKFSNKIVRFFGDHFIVHAQALKDQLTSIHNVCDSSISVIPHGTTVFSEEKLASQRPGDNTILFFGRIQDYKGIEYLIAAEPIISNTIKDFRIIIAGTGKSLRPYLKKIKNRNRFVIINKHIHENEMPALFQSASVVVLPYTDASQSGIIPIAYSYRKPVVATRIGGIPEVVDHGRTGILIPPHNTEELAKAICVLLKDETLAKKMGANGQSKLRTDLSWDCIAEKTMRVYERCLIRQLYA